MGSATASGLMTILQVHKAKLRKQKVSKQQRQRAAACTYHVVSPGDNVSSVARANNVLVSDIERLNAGKLGLFLMDPVRASICIEAWVDGCSL